MASKNITKDLPTLVFAVLLGAGAAWWRTEAETDLPEGTSAPVRSLAARGSDSAVTSSSSRLQSQEAVACASAWESLKDGRLSYRDRIEAQLAILDEWSRHDLAAVLVAYYTEPHIRNATSDGKERLDLLPAMAANPEIVEELLRSGRLGLQATELRALWFRHLAEADPIGVFERLGGFRAGGKTGMLGLVVSSLPSISEDPVIWQAGMDHLSAMIAAANGDSEIAKGLGSGNSFEDLNAAYLATGDPSLRDLLASAARFEALPDDPFADRSAIPEKIQSLPEPFRSAVIAKWK